MEIVLVLLALLVLAATAGGVVISRRSKARLEQAQREAHEARTKGRPPVAKAKPPATKPATARPAPPVAPDEVVIPEAEVELEAIDEAELERQALEALFEEGAVPEPEPGPRVKPRLRDRLGKARALLSGAFGDLRSREQIDEETWDDLEEALIRADVGVNGTQQLMDDLRRRAKETGITTPTQLLDLMKDDLVASLSGVDRSLTLVPGETNVWMFVGVNGVGKTTTIGKLGQRERANGRSVVMAAGDTFRAAAGEQLELWAQRVGADLVRGQDGADPGSVVFDAMTAASNRSAELVLVDTAGRLHTKVNLMEELKKLRRIVDRTPGALKEVLLVIDATTGQNGLVQAKQFGDAVDVTGIVLTKLDGTAKGGIVLAVQSELGIPVKLVGVGESADDLIEFDPAEFVDALFAE